MLDLAAMFGYGWVFYHIYSYLSRHVGEETTGYGSLKQMGDLSGRSGHVCPIPLEVVNQAKITYGESRKLGSIG